MPLLPPGPRLFKILGDDSRLRLLHILARTEFTVTELVSILEIHQSNISRHLTQLRSGGLVEDRREGALVYYRLSEELRSDSALRDIIARACKEVNGLSALDKRVESILDARREQSRIFFEKVAGKYRRLAEAGGGREGILSCLTSLVKIGTMVDIGCGDGKISFLMAPSCHRVIAVDQSDSMLTHLKKEARVREINHLEVRKGEMEKLPLENGEADFALMSQVLHHASDPESALAEMLRVLKPGGSYAVLDLHSHDQEWVREKLGDRWLGFDSERLGEWLSHAGSPPSRIEILPVDGGLPLVMVSGNKTGQL